MSVKFLAGTSRRVLRLALFPIVLFLGFSVITVLRVLAGVTVGEDKGTA